MGSCCSLTSRCYCSQLVSGTVQGSAALCSAVQCSVCTVMQCTVMLCSAIKCVSVQYGFVARSAVECSAMRYNRESSHMHGTAASASCHRCSAAVAKNAEKLHVTLKVGAVALSRSAAAPAGCRSLQRAAVAGHSRCTPETCSGSKLVEDFFF